MSKVFTIQSVKRPNQTQIGNYESFLISQRLIDLGRIDYSFKISIMMRPDLCHI